VAAQQRKITSSKFNMSKEMDCLGRAGQLLFGPTTDPACETKGVGFSGNLSRFSGK